MDHRPTHHRLHRVHVAVAVVALIVIASSLALVWLHASAHTRDQRRDAIVRRNTQIVALAVRAALARPVHAKVREVPVNVIQYVKLQSKQPDRFGSTFTWQGKRYAWPTNPFTGRPVAQGTSPGDVRLGLTWWGSVDAQGRPDAVKITGYGHDGQPLVTTTAWPMPQPVVP